MLIVKINGGLGNQMFQFAFYQYLKINNNEVYLDLSDFQIHSHHHGFELEKIFDLDFENVPLNVAKKYGYNQNSIVYRILNKYCNIRLTRRNDFYDFAGVSVINKDQINRDVYFTGYWQNYHYINTVDEESLRKQFEFKNQITESRNSQLLDIIKNKDSVSVHIRRGDYINNLNFQGICDEKYYNTSIDFINEKYTNVVFVVFSDDIEWCKNIFKNNKNFLFVDWNKGADSYIDMQLMSECKHNIIANSTFSWWGAWLNSNPDKTVIMPKKWDNTQTKNNLIGKNWITI